MKKLTTPLLIALLLSPTAVLAEDQPATQEEQNPVLVTVNGVGITADELRHFMSKQPSVSTPQEAIREMINVELLNQAAISDNIMEDKGLQLEIKRSNAALIASTYLQNYLDNLDISDEELQARYQADYVENSDTKEFNANHILVATEQEARNIILRLDQGEDFEELARKLSTGPSGKQGGSLGWFKKADMVAPFSAATAKLEKGKYSSEPVQTRFGWHVILLNDVRASSPPSIQSVSQELATAIAGDRIKEKLQNLQETAEIDFK